MNLSLFSTANLFESATNFFGQLGINLNSNTAEPLPVRDLLKQHFKETEIFQAIDKTFFIGIIDESIFRTTGMFDSSYSYKEAMQQADKSYDGLLLFALDLTKQPTRTEISELTRAFNRISHKLPVALVLKYKLKAEDEVAISITISERFKYKQNWREGEKAGKVIILRDIQTKTTHTGHLKILQDLVKPVAVINYTQLHEHWLKVLDVDILNKKFFLELANWYFWAMDNVKFPDDIEKKEEVRNATSLIRLITRIIFIWFIKEKKLVPANLFRKDFLHKILKDFDKDNKSQNYYHAILQNLFFGTLNQKMNERDFVKEGTFQQNKTEYGVKNLFRYADKFTISEKDVIQLFKDVPFLNGGLFDCLDRPNEEGKILYVDGFSRNPKRQAIVPDYLFFGEEQEVDLNEIFGTKNKKYKVKGLVNLLESYKFTVAENTPIEEEIALDPELLGKVFENLLASYNPETQTTARKQTGSFYTPREIVNYMVDESLIEYLKQKCNEIFPDFENRLRDLFTYSDNPNPFNEKETKILIKAINTCKMFDPACGSGAFPMGMLHRMVYLLTKLDPDNSKWKAVQEERIIGEKIKELEKDKNAIEGLSDAAVKEKARKAVDERLKEIKEIFESENNFDDYSRKLFLIENCIYGVDIQPIAVQITKLRFFISLIVDQNKRENKENLGIRSLPNLETKFVAANTLIGLEIPTTDLFSENNPIKALQEELKNVRHLYFNAKTRKDKLQFQNRDKQLRKAMSEKIKTLLVEKNEDEITQIQTDIEAANLVLQKIEKEPERVDIIEIINLFGEKEQKKINKKEEKIRAQKDIIKLLENNLKNKQNTFNKETILQVAENIASFDPYDQNLTAPFFEIEWMFGLTEGFDIVIGNPPYIAFQRMEVETKKVLQSLKYKTFENTGDIYALFYERGQQLLNDKGSLAYITSRQWMQALYGKSLRKFFATETDPIQLIDFGQVKIFEGATVFVNILLFKKHKNQNSLWTCHIPSDYNIEQGDLTAFFTTNKQEIKKLTENSWASSSVQNINEHIEKYGTPIGRWKDIEFFRGVTSGFNEAFYIEEPTKINLISQDPKNSEIIKPLLRGKDIKRYCYDFENWYILNTHNGVREVCLPRIDVIKDYPLIYKYLKQWQPQLEERLDKGDHWTNLRNCAFLLEFEKPKIVWIEISNRANYTYDDKGMYLTNSAYFLTCKSDKVSLKYILAVLNSKVADFYFSQKTARIAGGRMRYTKQYVEQIPIPEITMDKKHPFIKLVNNILSAKEENPEADTCSLDGQLDIMVYHLYNLTFDEAKIIDAELSEEEFENYKL